MRVIPTDVYDDEGNLTHIEFYNEAGSFEIQAEWDPSDEQTSENRVKFREWAYKFSEDNKSYEVLK